MPRKPAVEHATTIQTLLDTEGLLGDDGKVLGPAQGVWDTVAAKLEHKLKPPYLYVFFHGNRYGVQDSYLKRYNIGKVQIDRARSSSSAGGSESEDDPSCPTDNSPNLNSTVSIKQYTVVVSPGDWESFFKPVSRTYSRSDRNCDRTILVLPPFIYEDKLVELLWAQYKLPCPYSFGSSHVYMGTDADKYISIAAECKECGAKAKGTVNSEPLQGQPATIIWDAPDTRLIPHVTKRHLTRQRREQTGKALQGVSASEYRKQQANETMDMGDSESPLLATKPILRKAKQEEKDKKLSVEGGTNVALNIQKMKHREPYAGSIDSIGLDKFYVHNYSPSQLQVYKTHTQTEYTILIIDASGKIVRRLTIPGFGRTGVIFLYEAVIRNAMYQTPVLQMLSEKHDANSILHWLNEWQRAGAPPPKEVVIDNSPALKSASVRAFCKCSDVAEYKRRCFNLLFRGDATLPSCFLRLDVSNFLAAAARWETWKNDETKRLKQFYLHSLGLLIKCRKVDEFEFVLTAVLRLASSTHEGEPVDGEETPVNKSLQALSRMIKEGNPPAFQEDDIEDDPLPEDETETNCLEIQDFINKMQDKATHPMYKEGRLNPYYSPAVAKEFLRLANDFVLWTAVCVDLFKSPYETPPAEPKDTASSAPVESDFSDLKRNTLRGFCGQLRADKFIATHLQSIEGACRIAGAQQRNAALTRASAVQCTDLEDQPQLNPALGQDNTAVIEPSSSPTLDEAEEGPADLNNTENWKGLALIPKRQKRESRYLNPCPAMDVALQNRRLKPPKQRLLRNGNFMGFHEIEGGSQVRVSNTCTFDTLCHACAEGYIQYPSYRTVIDTSDENLFFKVSKSLAVNGAVAETYKGRASTLAALLPVTGSGLPGIGPRRRSLVQLVYDCYYELSEMAALVLESIPSAKIKWSCTDGCQKQETFPLLPVDVDTISAEGPEKIQTAIERALMMEAMLDGTVNPRAGHQCGGSQGVWQFKSGEFGPHLFINVDVFGQPAENNNHFWTIQLSEIQTHLEFGGSRYVLASVIARHPPDHFVALSSSSDGLWEVFNDLKKYPASAEGTANVSPVCLIYIGF